MLAAVSIPTALAHAVALVRSIGVAVLPHKDQVARLVDNTPARAAQALTASRLIMRVAAGAPMLFDYNGKCVADMGVAPPAQDWLRDTVAAQKVLLPAVFTSDIIVPP